MTETKGGYSSDSEIHVLLASEESEESSEAESPSPLSGKDTVLLDNSRISITSRKITLKVYKRRWLILGLFSLLSFMQARNQLQTLYFPYVYNFLVLNVCSALFGTLGAQYLSHVSQHSLVGMLQL